MYAPSSNHPNLFNDFNKKSEFKFLKGKKEFVAITFENVPLGKNFRWDKEWWKKVGIKWGMNEEEHEFEIPPNNLVSIKFKELSKKEKENIVDVKNDTAQQ